MKAVYVLCAILGLAAAACQFDTRPGSVYYYDGGMVVFGQDNYAVFPNGDFQQINPNTGAGSLPNQFIFPGDGVVCQDQVYTASFPDEDSSSSSSSSSSSVSTSVESSSSIEESWERSMAAGHCDKVQFTSVGTDTCTERADATNGLTLYTEPAECELETGAVYLTRDDDDITNDQSITVINGEAGEVLVQFRGAEDDSYVAYITYDRKGNAVVENDDGCDGDFQIRFSHNCQRFRLSGGDDCVATDDDFNGVEFEERRQGEDSREEDEEEESRRPSTRGNKASNRGNNSERPSRNERSGKRPERPGKAGKEDSRRRGSSSSSSSSSSN